MGKKKSRSKTKWQKIAFPVICCTTQNTEESNNNNNPMSQWDTLNRGMGPPPIKQPLIKLGDVPVGIRQRLSVGIQAGMDFLGHKGAAMGLTGMMDNLGKILGPILGGILLAWLDFSTTYTIMGGLLFLGMLFVVGVGMSERKSGGNA